MNGHGETSIHPYNFVAGGIKTYYLKLRFTFQDMPRMQDFAPFTPDFLGALSGSPAIRTTSQARKASP
jgi:hypothetical protein